jgi:hypothetical protein
LTQRLGLEPACRVPIKVKKTKKKIFFNKKDSPFLRNILFNFLASDFTVVDSGNSHRRQHSRDHHAGDLELSYCLPYQYWCQ